MSLSSLEVSLSNPMDQDVSSERHQEQKTISKDPGGGGGLFSTLSLHAPLS